MLLNMSSQKVESCLLNFLLLWVELRFRSDFVFLNSFFFFLNRESRISSENSKQLDV